MPAWRGPASFFWPSTPSRILRLFRKSGRATTIEGVPPNASKTRVIPFDGSLDLRATLGSRATAEPDGGRQFARRVSRTPAGLATTHIRVEIATVEAEAWGPGAEWALEHVPHLLGLDDHGSSFVAHHELIGRLHRRFHGLRIGRSGIIWDSLPHVILEQKVTGKEATRSWHSLVRAYGEDAPGPGELRAGPPPQALAELVYHQFHEHGVERKRAEIIINAARRINRINEALDMPIEQAYQRMMAVRGIGIWTTSLVLGQAMGDPDAIPIGDYHVKNSVSWALAGEPRGTDERMIELLEPYRGHRQRVVRLLHLGGIGAPKYGPRTQPRNIRNH